LFITHHHFIFSTLADTHTLTQYIGGGGLGCGGGAKEATTP
jgi:hypothetical protein